MQKKKNNPWYYYLNGSLVKKRKPAMPGDVVLISKPTTVNCKFTVVGEVYIGGFHDQNRNYYSWDQVFKASKVLDEIDNLRNFKENFEYAHELSSQDLKDEIETLKKDLEFAWLQTGEATAELKDFKSAVYDHRFHGSIVVHDKIDERTFDTHWYIERNLERKGFNVKTNEICDINATFKGNTCEVKFKFVDTFEKIFMINIEDVTTYHYMKFENLPF